VTVARRPLRALMVDSERSWRGGQGQVFLLMRGLAGAGLDVTLVAPADGALYERAAQLPVARIPWSGRSGAASVLLLRRIIGRARADVVHSHASRAHGAVAAARIGLRERPLHVVSRRVDFAVGSRPWGAWKYRRGADAYLAISNGVRDVLLQGGVAAESITVVPSGIDLDKFAHVRDPSYLRDEFAIRDDERVLVNVAALAPHKAQAILLQSLQRLAERRVRCFIVGDGPLRESLARRAAELGVDKRVVFTGFRNDALEFIRLADVFVMSSHLEGLGTSIMDAQALGAAVVATRTGGIPEIVEHGVTGLLAPPDEPAPLADAIARMLDDGELRDRCIRSAKSQSAGYDYRRMVYKTLDVYRRLCHVQPPLEGISSE